MGNDGNPLSKRPYELGKRLEQMGRTKVAVLSAAREQLEAGGMEEFSMESLAKASGVTRQTIHNLFGTRTGVLETLFESALERAAEAAAGQDVSLGGGADAAQQYLRARLIDQMEVHVVPVLLGAGARLFDNLGGGPEGYEFVGLDSSAAAAHYTYVRKP